jgi:hypothetical protein
MKTKYLLSVHISVFRFTLLLVIMTGFILQSFAQTQVITNPTSPWTVPAGVTSVKVEVWGGGGGGGGASSGGNSGERAGSGGGGGAYNVATFTVIPTQNYTITKGTGGAGQVGNIALTGANNGTASSVSGTAGTVTANPGTAGYANNGAVGAGGTGGVYDGGNGGNGANGTVGNSGGGGGGAGNNGDGGFGTNTTAGSGGTGSPNIAPYIGGAGGAPRTTNGTGNAGNAPGGGGGGGRGGGGTTATGGAGAAGQVVITYMVAPTSASVDRNNFCADDAGNISLSYVGGFGTTLKWYAGGCGSGTFIGSGNNLSIASPTITTTFYARWESDPLVPTACASVPVTVIPLPDAPTVTSPVHYCLNATASPLTASGSGLLWYTDPAGGTGSSTAPTPSTASAGTVSYYVSQTVGCESPRAQIDVIVHLLPSASASKTDVSCFNTNTGQIVVSGSGGSNSYTYYSIYNGGSFYQTSNTFSGLSAGTYRVRVKDSNGCESPAIPTP